MLGSTTWTNRKSKIQNSPKYKGFEAGIMRIASWSKKETVTGISYGNDWIQRDWY